MTDKPTQAEGLNRVFAETGSRTDPDTITPGKVAEGWVAEIPPFQFFNWAQYFTFKMCNHINEEGLPLWDANTSYPLNAYVKSAVDGLFYISNVAPNQGNEPSVSAQWDLFSQGGAADTDALNNASTVTGTSCSDALENLQAQIQNTGVEIFTSNGTFNTPANARRLKFTLVGGGGGGGGTRTTTGAGSQTGGSGAGGTKVIGYIEGSLASSYAIVIGAGGLGGQGLTDPIDASPTQGVDGSSTTVNGTVLVADGGGGALQTDTSPTGGGGRGGNPGSGSTTAPVITPLISPGQRGLVGAISQGTLTQIGGPSGGFQDLAGSGGDGGSVGPGVPGAGLPGKDGICIVEWSA